MTKQLSQEIITKKLPELQLVLGGIAETKTDEFVPTADALIAKRIPESDKSFIAKNNEWQTGKVYEQWDLSKTSNYYVYNPENRIVYLCTDNRTNNDLAQEVAMSTVLPSDIAPGVFKTSDGYSWCPLFKVDINQLKFLSKTDLPLPKLEKPQNFLTVSETYEDFCVDGVTNFGCCCLYYKENTTDPITGVSYDAGDLTNEIVFSKCYECQDIAQTSNKESIFLAGYTAGIIGSATGPSAICPQSKTIKTFQEQLTEDQYDLAPGSSREYALYLLDNFTNELGIMAARIDLTGLTDQQKTVYTTSPNPEITIIDPTGTGATARILTEQIGQDTHLVNGIELLTSGSGYSEVPDWSSGNTFIDGAIQLIRFPKDFYNEPTQLVPEIKVKIKTQIASYQIKENVEAEQITKIAVMVNPKRFVDNSVIEEAPQNQTISNLQTKVFVGTGTVYSDEAP